jgi:Fur family ferric uptake transcriptional regulator
MDFQEAAQRLYDAGLRMTRPRESLLNLLLSSDEPFSVKTLHERAEAAGLNMHLATVHRNLNEFVTIGLVDELPGDDNRLYALHNPSDGRGGAHVYCLDCRLVVPFDMPDAGPQAALIQALIDKGFDASTLRLTLSAHCQQKAHLAGEDEPSSASA